MWCVCFLLISLMGCPSEAHHIILSGQQKRLKAISGIIVQINHSDVTPDNGLIFSPDQNLLRKTKQFLQLISNQHELVSSVLHIRFSEIWAISSSAAC